LKGEGLVAFNRSDEIELRRIQTGGAPNGLTFDYNGRALFCDSGQNSVRIYDPSDGSLEVIIDTLDTLNGKPLDKPNDLAFDSIGNLLFTCPGNSRTEPTGYVCCATPEGEVSVIADGLFFPNGLVFYDEETLVIAETYNHRLWIGKWDPNVRIWKSPGILAEVGGSIGPDGMAVGEDGLIYTAVFGTASIKAVSTGGEIVRVVTLPGECPTNCAFDPSGELGLVVTEAEKGLLLSITGVVHGRKLFDGRQNV
jgi:gluconolactonase